MATRARQRRAAAVRAWIDEHGLVCPGLASLDHEPHSVADRRDLTADHIRPQSAGGSEWGPLRVLCRSANSRRPVGAPPPDWLTTGPPSTPGTLPRHPAGR